MKNLFFVFMLCLPVLLIGQTLSVEKEALFKKIAQENHLKSTVNEMSKGLVDLFAKFKEYPELPYNPETELIEFSKVYNLKGMSKNDIFDQVKEWIAINYGAIDVALLYQNKEKGKIITKGYFNIIADSKFINIWGKSKSTTFELGIYHTAIFSIKDGKLKIEFVKMDYSYMTGGYDNGEFYVPLEEQRHSLSSIYPIVLGDYSEWEFRLSLLHKTSAGVNLTMKSISDYLNDKDKDNF